MYIVYLENVHVKIVYKQSEIMCSSSVYNVMLISSNIVIFIFCSNSQYLDNNATNHATETMSRDCTLFDDNCKYHVTTCAKLITDKLIGVICIDHVNNSKVSLKNRQAYNHKYITECDNSTNYYITHNFIYIE